MRLERWLNAIVVVIGFVSVLGLAHPPGGPFRTPVE
jgi:hypothetical protein